MITNTELEYKGNLVPNAYKSHKKSSNIVTFQSENNVLLQVHVVRDSIWRFRYAPAGFFAKDFSYAIDEQQPHGFNELNVQETDTSVEITTKKIKCVVAKQDLRIGLYDLDGQVICEDEMGFHWEESFEFGGNYVKMSKSSPEGENFFGLGDKPTHLNLKGKRLSNWNTDQYAYGKDLDELYKTVPFYIALHNKMAYGIFFDNTFKTHFDFCHERRNVTSFWADGGRMVHACLRAPGARARTMLQ